MKGRVRWTVAGALALGAAAAGTAALATGGGGIRETLTGYQEDPLVLSTSGSGEIKAHVRAEKQQISYRLSYKDLEGAVTQAHIHLGGRAQSGGIIVFLCTTPAIAAPPGTPTCPPAPATIRGTLEPGDVIGPAAQGIGAGEFGELIAAIRAGVTYANLHTDKYPGGEIRAQLEQHEDDD